MPIFLSPFLFLPLMLAILPSIFWFALFLWEDREEPEPRALLGRLFVAGIGAAFLAIALEFGFRRVLWSLFPYTAALDAGSIALIEKGLMFFFVLAIAWRHKAFTQIIDGVVYAVAVALGFATVENFLFFADWVPRHAFGGDVEFARLLGTVALLRFLLTTSLHTFSVGVLGFGMGVARFAPRGKWWWILGGLAMAVALHAGFDLVLLRGYLLEAMVATAGLGIAFLLLIRRRAAVALRTRL